MTGIRRLLAAAACLVPCLCAAQADCAQFTGAWSGTWSQGFYGTQWIHVTQVSADCIAQVAYSPVGAAATTTHSMPVRDGAIQFPCNAGTGGTCRLEVRGGELLARYWDPSGFVNNGIFRKNP